MKSSTPYEAELDGRRKAVHDARQHVILLEAELRGFEAAAAFLTRTTSPAEADNAGVDHRVGIRGNWRAILTATAPHYPAPTTLDDFIRIADGLGTPTTRNTLRSQMSIYSTAGYLERVGQGEYRLTAEGAKMLGVTINHPSAAPERDNNTGETTPDPEEEGNLLAERRKAMSDDPALEGL